MSYDPHPQDETLQRDVPISRADAAQVEPPERIGRYRIEKVLGQGGFGIVYLAEDEQLQRRVAIKVPHAELITRPDDVEAYLTEARTVAGLDHPHIVPVYDVGSTDKFPCYIISKYIKGTDLNTRLKESRLGFSAAAEMVATIAEALHYAHKQGLVDRDVKPGNILLDQDDQPHVVDLGLALREADVGKGPRYAGTPAYMSPEQARGEGHRVDGRSDIYSLGAVLYELLTGRRTVTAMRQHEVLEQITRQEIKPPRQIDDRIPKELERICLKALAKRASDRYMTALDMAEDLRHYLAMQPPSSTDAAIESSDAAQSDSTRVAQESSTTRGDSAKEDSDSRPIKIIPKGLRSFDAHDADFFLELLPGPRDREGLPDSIRFWKTRVEETDADETFAVGLIYGPSGCGKSSLVKAGLLPRLSENVIPVYVESTPDDTERRLLHGLRKRCPDLEESLSLKDMLAALRQGQGLPVGKKVLIVLDQFEQWLHAEKEQDNTELVQALRQCDGGRVQCIVMVRDDFWLAVSRFLRALEIRLVEGQNSALADIFYSDHARRVLAAFGRAFGKLPENAGEMTNEQRDFLEQSVAGLAEEGKVICVRLALFAEMMKGKAWTPATLQEVGGARGVGVTFLDETFSASTAPPEHRYHQKAARAVLKSLLPDAGTDIKGHMRSRDELLAASGFANRAQDFDDLIRILDAEIRLISPTDPEGKESDEDAAEPTTDACQRYYQLTHDYLVPSLREWLTRKQKETRQGRAELTLADRAAVWNARRENRQLPSLLQWWRIRWYTDSKQWTPSQRKMMARAGRVLVTRATITASAILVTALAIWQLLAWQQRELERLELQTAKRNTAITVDSLQAAQGIAVRFVLEKLDALPRELVVAELQRRFPETHGQAKLSLAYGLAQYERPDIDAIIAAVIDHETQADEVMNIVGALRPVAKEAIPKLQQAAQSASDQQDWSTKTRLATLSLYLGDSALAAEMLRDGPSETGPDVEFDPIQRTQFIAIFPTWPGNLRALASVDAEMNNGALRSGLALSTGGIERPSREVKEAWGEILQDWYVNASDGGTHGAAGWALQQWELDIPSLADSSRFSLGPLPDRDWWQWDELTMIRIHKGSVRGENGPVVVERDFWLSDREISVGLFQQFIDDADYKGLKPRTWQGAKVFDDDASPDLPVQQVSWLDAVMFCNWLSWKLDQELTYKIVETNVDGSDEKLYTVELLPGDGIRLPTEAEWEYACRATTTTAFAFGSDDATLKEYGWYIANSTFRTCPRGAKQCNAWGLFDMHGNLWEWCWDRFSLNESYRTARGGSWNSPRERCQSSASFGNTPTDRHQFLGFRVARGPLG